MRLLANSLIGPICLNYSQYLMKCIYFFSFFSSQVHLLFLKLAFCFIFEVFKLFDRFLCFRVCFILEFLI